MPGKTTPLEDKKRIIAAHQRGEDAILLGRQLGVKSRTTYNIIRTCEQRGGVIAVPRGGARHTKVTDEMKQVLEDIISENCTLSLREIKNLQIRLKITHFKCSSFLTTRPMLVKSAPKGCFEPHREVLGARF